MIQTSLPLPFRDQFECRNETLEVYGSDRRGKVNYQFNNLGYRNDIDYADSESDVGVYIGSSITAAIGLDWVQSYSKISSENLSARCYHFAQGCVAVDNAEILTMLKSVKFSKLKAKFYVIQFIGLDRRYDRNSGSTTYESDHSINAFKFIEIFQKIKDLLRNDCWCFFGCDESDNIIGSKIRTDPRCVAWNFPYVDFSGVGQHPGQRWHQIIARGVEKKILQSSYTIS
jgi:hypothetical protein